MISIDIVYRYLQNKRLNKNGTAPIVIQAYNQENYKRKQFKTGIKIKPNQWHPSRWVVKHPQSDQLRAKLRKQKDEMEAFLLNRTNRNLPTNLRMLGEYRNASITTTFTDFFDQKITDTLTNTDTIRDHKLTLKYLKEVQEKIYFNEVNLGLIHRFNTHLLKKGLHINTIASKHHKHLKKYIRLAIDFEYIDRNKNPYDRYKIKTAPTEITFLRPQDVDKLEALIFTEDQFNISISRDLYLFGVWTGLRSADLRSMTANNLLETPQGLIYQKISKKTKKPFVLYLRKLFAGKPERLMQRYLKEFDDYYYDDPDNPKTIFFDRAGSTINEDLKVLARKANIDPYKQDKITIHTARHTFGTIMVTKVSSITTVQRLMQHSSLRQTMRYLHADSYTVNRDLDAAQWKK